jgi:hypothetical protein
MLLLNASGRRDTDSLTVIYYSECTTKKGATVEVRSLHGDIPLEEMGYP